MTTLALLILPFLAALLVGIPIVFSLCLAALLMLWVMDLLAPTLVVQRMFAGLDSFPMMAIPFFMLAGALMEKGGISSRLVRFSNYLVGWITGGLAHVAIVASIFFAGITGSAVAETTAIGSTMLPIMKRRGFEPRFSASVIAAAGVIGPIIPPSIPAVIYGSIASVSIGALFIGGVIPGVFMGICLMVLTYFIAKKRNYPRETTLPTAREFLLAAFDASAALVMPVIIVGGVLGGIFTATEAAVVAVVYAFMIGMFWYRELGWRDIPELLFRAGLSSAMVLIIVGVANLVGFILAFERVPLMLAETMEAFTHSAYVVLLLINIMLLIVGCFLDGASALIIFTPVLMPMVHKYGIDPVFFGVMMTVNLMIGMITPPVGINLYVTAQLSGSRVEEVIRTVIPFFLVELFVLILMVIFPEIVTFLPDLLMN
jgi:tripartite ATP-independent transporter DctM subunit